MDIFKSCVDRQNRIDKVVNILDSDEVTIKNQLVKDRIINPAHYVVMLGETSSGKSALINSIFDRKILVESVRPTTGVVTEVVIDEKEEESLIAISDDLTREVIDEDRFAALTTKPIGNLMRLKYVGRSKNKKYNGIRIFDTPGYGSLIEKHEEVLKEFIPESDFIIYVVSYKTGVGEDDFQFLKYVGEIINKNVEVVLAVNMCPENTDETNKRICEIKKAVSECLHIDTKVFLIESSSEKNPATDELWDYIYKRVTDPSKEEELAEVLKSYQDYVLRECNIKINSKIADIESAKVSTGEKVDVIKEFLDEKKNILDSIENGFVKIKLQAIRLIGKFDLKIKEDVKKYIYDESKWTMKEETFNLMQHYYVPKLTNEETDNLNSYIEDEIIALDREIEKLLSAEIIKLEENVKKNNSLYSEVIEEIIEKHRGDIIKQATGEMFRRAENGLGESKNLKKLLNAFERVSYGDTNNNLNHVLKTIKAASVKGITESLSVFTDSIFFLYDSLTWQKKIEEISMTAVDKWASNIDEAVRRYLDKMKEANMEQVRALFYDLSKEFKNNKKELEDISSEELTRLKTEIDFLLNKCLLINLKK
ncbi:GTPase Era involved in 16S rRNA processing [Clostridium saccharoperbutylacetonicum]|uniref:Dynamin family n=2 Tax=Clostridium TaxID=1485 RepID=M1MTW0_9CLOT|nr:dynamin family protein [Clostridium saccharoperbutylacetonicum]AGF58136.1 dynamin family [Clostridium saccharoperbutylacetonicum N1-4(HMT)]NRT61090.1 GTPase Era involved in 16S rRNA processing [Clostridium saccharoperbutylacetonicum]NSB24405.1 GTPase Era involved in 16S rRNA processing [Clostridium saccharoperbutylacetonicum]NSB43781.1 GTPase Era involved in 16S rRNA processing [Clostridium saccharoperbutylacetonicum]